MFSPFLQKMLVVSSAHMLINRRNEYFRHQISVCWKLFHLFCVIIKVLNHFLFFYDVLCLYFHINWWSSSDGLPDRWGQQESLWTATFADDTVICSESSEQVRWRCALERRYSFSLTMKTLTWSQRFRTKPQYQPLTPAAESAAINHLQITSLVSCLLVVKYSCV